MKIYCVYYENYLTGKQQVKYFNDLEEAKSFRTSKLREQHPYIEVKELDVKIKFPTKNQLEDVRKQEQNLNSILICLYTLNNLSLSGIKMNEEFEKLFNEFYYALKELYQEKLNIKYDN